MNDSRGPLTFRGGGPSAGWAIIIAILAAILVGAILLTIPGCGTLSPALKPAQHIAPVVAPAVAGTGNTTTTTTDVTSSQHSEQTTAGMAAKMVAGNQVTVQGITNSQLGAFLGLGVGIVFVLLGVLVGAPALTTAESVYLEVFGSLLIVGTLYVMLVGHVPSWL